MSTALSSPQARAVPFGKVSLGLLVPPVGKKNPGRTASIPTRTVGHFVETFTLISHHRDINQWGSTTGNMTMSEKGEGLAVANTLILTDQVLT